VAVFREAPAMEMSNAAPISPPSPPLPSPRLDARPLSKAAPAAAAGTLAAPPAQEAHRARDSGVETVDAARAQPRSAPERLGTGHGARESSVVRITTFQRASTQPEQRIEIRYDSLDNLVAAGIVAPPRVATTTPHAFPADPPRDYVPDPR
jgi:hypothetical protein